MYLLVQGRKKYLRRQVRTALDRMMQKKKLPGAEHRRCSKDLEQSFTSKTRSLGPLTGVLAEGSPIDRSKRSVSGYGGKGCSTESQSETLPKVA